MVRTSTRAGWRAVISRVAAMPSSSGMRMSISTTSGSRRPALWIGLVAVGRLADDLDVGMVLEHEPEAGAHERLVVGDQDADAHAPPIGSRAWTRKPPLGRRPTSSVPP